MHAPPSRQHSSQQKTGLRYMWRAQRGRHASAAGAAATPLHRGRAAHAAWTRRAARQAAWLLRWRSARAAAACARHVAAEAGAASVRGRRGKPPCRVKADSLARRRAGRTSCDRSGATAGPAACPLAPRGRAVALPPQAATGAANMLRSRATGKPPSARSRTWAARKRCDVHSERMAAASDGPRGREAPVVGQRGSSTRAAAARARPGASCSAGGTGDGTLAESRVVSLAAQNGAQQRAQGRKTRPSSQPRVPPCCTFSECIGCTHGVTSRQYESTRCARR